MSSNKLFSTDFSEQKQHRKKPHKSSPGKTLLLNSFLADATTIEPRPINNIFVNLYKDIDRPDPIQFHESDDELFLLIDDNGSSRSLSDCRDAHNDDDDSGVHVEYRQHVLAKKCNAAQQLLPKKLQETPKRNKGRSKTAYDQLRQNNLNRKLFAPPKPLPIAKSLIKSPTDLFPRNLPELQQSSRRHEDIEYEIAKRMVDMGQLLQYEEDVTVKLTKRCAQYRAQNELYHAQSGRLELCIDRVQAKLEQYAKDIVENELELFKIKMEITQKCGVLHNLQRMLRMETGGEVGGWHEEGAMALENSIRSAATNDINFVDNIYEFCDNNRSIVV